MIQIDIPMPEGYSKCPFFAEFKLYLVTCCSNYNNGDYIEYGSYAVGIYSTIDLAEQAGLNELQKNYKWDEEFQKYYGSYSDEAWIEIRECSIDKPIDFNEPAIQHIPKEDVKLNDAHG